MNAPVTNNVLSLLAPAGTSGIAGAAGAFGLPAGQSASANPLFAALLAQAVSAQAPAAANLLAQANSGVSAEAVLQSSTLLSPAQIAALKETDEPSVYDLLATLMQPAATPATAATPAAAKVASGPGLDKAAPAPVAPAPSLPVAAAPATAEITPLTPAAQKLINMIEQPFAPLLQAEEGAATPAPATPVTATAEASTAARITSFIPSSPPQVVSGTNAFLTQISAQQQNQNAVQNLNEGMDITAEQSGDISVKTELAQALQPAKKSAAALENPAQAAPVAVNANTKDGQDFTADVDGLEIQTQSHVAPKSDGHEVKAPESRLHAQAFADAEAVRQISTQLGSALKAGAHKITVALSPQELGQVEIQVEYTEDNRHAKVSITADRADTLSALQRDAKDLVRNLAQVGLQTDSRDLSFHLNRDGQQQAGTSHGQQHGHSQQQAHNSNTPTPVTPANLADSSVAIVVLSNSLSAGGVNIMI